MENIFQYYSNFLLKFFFNILFIFGPNLAFISQISNFRISKSNKGFSKKTTLLILLADIFRIFFWLGKRFEKTLLIQSFVSIFMQLFLLYECLKVSNEDNFISISNKKENNNFKINSNDLFTDIQETIEETNLIKSENQININIDEDMEIKDDYVIININNKNNKENKNNINKNKNNDYDNNKKEEDIKIKNNKINMTRNEIKIMDLDKDKDKIIDNYNKNQHKCQYQDQDIENLIDIMMKNKTDLISKFKFNKEGNFKDIFNHNLFWEWPFLINYIIFLLFFSIILLISFSFFGQNNELYKESLGYFTMFLECSVAIPQIIQNYSNKSTKNLSVTMIVIWLIGDSFKTLYFLKYESPFQFIIAGIIQIIFDCIIIGQMSYYK
jgi:hypothetical protein